LETVPAGWAASLLATKALGQPTSNTFSKSNDVAKICRKFKVSRATFYRYLKWGGGDAQRSSWKRS